MSDGGEGNTPSEKETRLEQMMMMMIDYTVGR